MHSRNGTPGLLPEVLARRQRVLAIEPLEAAANRLAMFLFGLIVACCAYRLSNDAAAAGERRLPAS